jgi:hypothetical protein
MCLVTEADMNKARVKQFAGLLLIGLGLALILLPTYGSAADSCPKGVKEYSKDGGDGEVSWYSYATLAKIDDTDWCYHRKVVLYKPERQYVNWPKGEIHRKDIVKEWVTRSCCYPEPRAENGDLEHGYSGKKIPTQVYRGSTEPKQNQTWVSIEGSVYLEPRIVRVDLTLRSTIRKTPDGFSYGYEISNFADVLTVVWKSAESDFFVRVIKERRLSYPLVLEGKSGLFKASGFSSRSPQYMAQDLILLSADGREIFRMIVPAYVPK